MDYLCELLGHKFFVILKEHIMFLKYLDIRHRSYFNYITRRPTLLWVISKRPLQNIGIINSIVN